MRRSGPCPFTRVLELALVSLALACADAPTVARPDARTAHIPISLSLAGTSAVGVVVRVTAPDIASPLVFNLSASGAAITGSVVVPVGRDRTITFEAVGPSGTVTHRGVAGPLAVADGLNAAVDIRLLPVGDEREIGAAMGYYLRVSPGATTLTVGERVRLTALAADPSGVLVTVPSGTGGISTIQWASTDPTRAAVDTSGTVVAIAPGDVDVVAVARGGAARARLHVAAAAPSRWRAIATAYRTGCGVGADSLVYCWGSNQDAMLATGVVDSVAHATPQRVAVGGARFGDVAGGFQHVCALSVAGAAYCWGANGAGALGNGTSGDPCTSAAYCTAPQPVLGVPALAALSSGWRHVCGATSDGQAWCWGADDGRQLGAVPGSTCGAAPDAFDCSRVPLRVPSLTGVTAVAAGGSHSCALRSDGTAWCWGRNTAGELGVDPSSMSACAGGAPCTRDPVLVSGGLTFRQLSLGDRVTCGVTTSDAMYCWGANDAGQLGRGVADGDAHSAPQPVTVAGLAGARVLQASVSMFDRACALLATGEPRCWGTGYGAAPALSFAGALRFASLGQSGAHGCAITTRGTAYCWGRSGGNALGSLGDGTTITSYTPVLVANPLAP